MVGALMILLVACDPSPSGPSPSSPGTSSDGAAGTAPGASLTWLDDEAVAQSVSHHRIAGRLRSPTIEEGKLRKQARDALVERARSLGFARLDNLQIEVACTGTDDPATPCEARFLAIASR